MAIAAANLCIIWDTVNDHQVGGDLIFDTVVRDVSFSPSGRTLMMLTDNNGELHCVNLSSAKRTVSIPYWNRWYDSAKGSFAREGTFLARCSDNTFWTIDRLD